MLLAYHRNEEKHLNTMKPLLAISAGDPAGISPEIVARCLPEALCVCRPLVFGHWPTLEQEMRRASVRIDVDLVERAQAPDVGRVAVVHCGLGKKPIEKPDDWASLAQAASLDRAVDAVLGGVCAGLVTAPVSKELMARSIPGFIGHTEHLASRSGVPSDAVTMLFASPAWAVGLVTTHLPLRDVPSALTRERLERTTRHLVSFLARTRPGARLRIGVAALNPHAGEAGLFGSEERDLLAPFVERSSAGASFDLVGPIPADALFRETLVEGRFDGVVALYHDQALVPLKLGGVGATVNVTMGLPFARTSPDHGVAYDRARRNAADFRGMLGAVELAARLAR